MIQAAWEGRLRRQCSKPIANSESPSVLRPSTARSCDVISKIKVGVPAGNGGNAYIPLSELATISLDTGASYIFRERNRRFVPIKFSVRGRDLAAAVEEAQKRSSKNIKLPTGYRVEWAGEFEGLQSAQKRSRYDRANHARAHHGAAVRDVQFVARQPDGIAGIPFCSLRRDTWHYTSLAWISAFPPRLASCRCLACRS